jgi:hypothetical protein
MTRGAGRCAAVLAVAAALPALSGNAVAQSCPEPLASARRLVLVTADGMATSKARLRLYERAAPGAALQSAAQGAAWRPVGGVAPAIIGRNGLGWSFAFRQLAARGEPVKVDGDKRAPAGIYRLGATFGLAPTIRRRPPTTPSPRARRSAGRCMARTCGASRTTGTAWWSTIRPIAGGMAAPASSSI